MPLDTQNLAAPERGDRHVQRLREALGGSEPDFLMPGVDTALRVSHPDQMKAFADVTQIELCVMDAPERLDVPGFTSKYEAMHNGLDAQIVLKGASGRKEVFLEEMEKRVVSVYHRPLPQIPVFSFPKKKFLERGPRGPLNHRDMQAYNDALNLVEKHGSYEAAKEAALQQFMSENDLKVKERQALIDTIQSVKAEKNAFLPVLSGLAQSTSRAFDVAVSNATSRPKIIGTFGYKAYEPHGWHVEPGRDTEIPTEQIEGVCMLNGRPLGFAPGVGTTVDIVEGDVYRLTPGELAVYRGQCSSNVQRKVRRDRNLAVHENNPGGHVRLKLQATVPIAVPA